MNTVHNYHIDTNKQKRAPKVGFPLVNLLQILSIHYLKWGTSIARHVYAGFDLIYAGPSEAIIASHGCNNMHRFTLKMLFVHHIIKCQYIDASGDFYI